MSSSEFFMLLSAVYIAPYLGEKFSVKISAVTMLVGILMFALELLK